MKVGVYKDGRNRNRPWIVRWFGVYNSATGKRRRYTKSFRLKVQAEEFQASQSEGFRKGAQRDVAGKTRLDVFCTSFLKVRKGDLRSGTVTLYENSIERLLSYFGPNCLLSSITPQSGNEFVAELKRMDGQSKPLSNWARQRVLRNCKTLFQTAVTWELIARNPFAKVKAPRCVTPKWHYIKASEYKELFKIAPSLRRKCIYALAYCCGLRFGELFSLTWTDVDFEARELTVQDHPSTTTRPPFAVKDFEARTIPIAKHCLKLLVDLRTYNSATDQTPYVLLDESQYKTVIAKWKRDQRNNRAWRNQDLAPSALCRFKKDVERAGIIPTAKLTIQTLRKSCVLNWANEVSNPEVVRVLAGHSDLKTTMEYYSQITDDQRARAAAETDRLLETVDVRMTYDDDKGALNGV